jgi:uncharacterized RDD family membrane protein YckC
MKTSTLIIRTPEGIVFSQLLAGPVTRFFAWFIDQLCIQAAMTLVGLLITLLVVINSNFAVAFYVLAYFAVSVGYGIFFEWSWRGQTIGKRLFRLRVTDVEGMRLQFNQIVVRNLLRFVDALPAFYLVGGLTCWLNSKSQRLGDIAANTIVIHAPRIAEPEVWTAITSLLDRLNSVDAVDATSAINPKLVLAEEGMRLLSAFGWGLELERCVRCGRPCEEGKAALVDPVRGGLVCRACGGARLRISGALRARLMVPALEPEDVDVALDLVERALEAHAGTGGGSGGDEAGGRRGKVAR